MDDIEEGAPEEVLDKRDDSLYVSPTHALSSDSSERNRPTLQRDDIEEGDRKEVLDKRDDSLYVSPTHVLSSDSSERNRPTLQRNHPKHDTVTLARVSMVESNKSEHVKVQARHIVKIFINDDDFIEVSPEQVERVKMMHQSIEDNVTFSFNYNVLLLVASVLAGLGLVSNSGTTVIASMLVSPIMGPVIGLAYGTTINDWKLVRLSLRNECISLLFCIVVGIIIAAITGMTDLADDWMTNEMASRATSQAVKVALPVAFFSGLGVAVSLLDNQTSSLVGVAISASLLPPAVNAGILWIFYAYIQTGVLEAPQREGMPLSNFSAVDSLLITIMNILLIWISSMFMFRMKEVLPIEKNVFWSDLGVARKIYRKRALLQVFEVEEPDAPGTQVDDATP